MSSSAQVPLYGLSVFRWLNRPHHGSQQGGLSSFVGIQLSCPEQALVASAQEARDITERFFDSDYEDLPKVVVFHYGIAPGAPSCFFFCFSSYLLCPLIGAAACRPSRADRDSGSMRIRFFYAQSPFVVYWNHHNPRTPRRRLIALWITVLFPDGVAIQSKNWQTS